MLQEGVGGIASIVTAVGEDTQPAELVTVKLYVPEERPEIVVLFVLPEIAPGFIVQFPVGSPSNTTVPVPTVQVGCVMDVTTGAVKKSGCVTTTNMLVASQPLADVIVTV